MNSLIEIMILFTSCRTLENMLLFLKASLGETGGMLVTMRLLRLLGESVMSPGPVETRPWTDTGAMRRSRLCTLVQWECTLVQWECTLVQWEDRTKSHQQEAFIQGRESKTTMLLPNLDGFQSFFLLMFNFAFCWLIKKPLWINELWGQLLGSRLCYYYR